MRWISTIVPARYYIEIVRDVFLQGGGWPAVWYAPLMLAALGVALLLARLAQDAADAGATHEAALRQSCSAGGSAALFLKEMRQIGRNRRLDHSMSVIRRRCRSSCSASRWTRGDGPAARHRRREPLGGEPRAGLGLRREPHVRWPATSTRRRRSASAQRGRARRRRSSSRPTSRGKRERGAASACRYLARRRRTRTRRADRAGYAARIRRARFNQARRRRRNVPGRQPDAAAVDGPRVALLYNPGLESTWFIVTGMLGMLLVLNGSLVAAASMVKEKEVGTVEQLLMTPARLGDHHGEDGAAVLLLLSATSRSRSRLGRAGLRRAGARQPPARSISAGALCVLAGIGIGTFIATFSRSQQQAQLDELLRQPARSPCCRARRRRSRRCPSGCSR